jgi:hypothetical protein
MLPSAAVTTLCRCRLVCLELCGFMRYDQRHQDRLLCCQTHGNAHRPLAGCLRTQSLI